MKTSFESELAKISSTYQVSENHAGCYLSNYENKHICHRHNGDSKNIEKRREISKKEGENNAEI